ncbi:MAG: hypothetical protein GY928_37390 [Colwellia sp.]|nr:hypothetical protein [Colwellia sp.]
MTQQVPLTLNGGVEKGQRGSEHRILLNYAGILEGTAFFHNFVNVCIVESRTSVGVVWVLTIPQGVVSWPIKWIIACHG